MRFDLEGLDDLALSLSEIAEIPDDIQAEILNTQADDFIREVKNRGAGYGVGAKKGTGQLLKSIKKGKIRRLKTGLAIYVQPTGSRKRGKKKVTKIKNGYMLYFPMHFPVHGQWWSCPATHTSHFTQWVTFMLFRTSKLHF